MNESLDPPSLLDVRSSSLFDAPPDLGDLVALTAQQDAAHDVGGEVGTQTIIWVVVAVVVVLGVLVYALSRRRQRMEAEGEREAREKREKRESVVAPEEYEERKDQLSLAEIKTAKQADVVGDLSKEKLKELRKERRAATQTRRAVAGRDEEDETPDGDEASIAEKAVEEVAPGTLESEDESTAEASAEAGVEPSADLGAEPTTGSAPGALDFGQGSAEPKVDEAAAPGIPSLGSLGTARPAAAAETDNDSGSLDLSSALSSGATPAGPTADAEAALEKAAEAADKAARAADEAAEAARKAADAAEKAAAARAVEASKAEAAVEPAKPEPAKPEAKKPEPKKPEAKKPEPKKPEAKKPEPKSLRDGLSETRNRGFVARLGKVFGGKLDEDVVDELEEVLFTADIGVVTSRKLLNKVERSLDRKELSDGDKAVAFLREEIRTILDRCEKPLKIRDHQKPFVVLVVGVNGAGKTTTIGKLAAKLTDEGNKVLLVAGDTFRAAAIEQLEEWGERTGCRVHRGKQGADPSSVIFDGLKVAEDEGFDVVLADTAGRLHNKKDLVDELKKITRVAGKAIKGAPHHSVLVLDATNGQNALMQAKEFREAVDYSGIIMTKLDGTAKGGVIIGICDELKVPVHYIGIGEMIDDLRPFRAEEFVEALF